MVSLTRRRPVVVKYTGGRDAVGPLTLGQLSIFDWLSRSGECLDARVHRRLYVPDAFSVDDLGETLSVLLTRHEGLRTSFEPGPPPIQRVAASGELAIDVFAVADDAPTDQNALAAELERRLAVTEDRAPALRVAMVTRGDRVLAAVLECTHLVADHAALAVLDREFTELARDPAAREVGGPRLQPLDRAAEENLPRQRRRAAEALTYWADQLRRMPPLLYVMPRTDRPRESGMSTLVSAPAAAAVDRVAARTRVSRPSVIIAAVCAVLAHRTGYRQCVFPIISSNRYERKLADYIGTLAAASIFAMDVDAAGFDELVRRAWAANVRANTYGFYDAFRRVEIADRIAGDRGVRFSYEPLLNNFTADSARSTGMGRGPEKSARTSAVPVSRSPTTVDWVPLPPHQRQMTFNVLGYEPVVWLRLFSNDTSRLCRAEMESLLLAVERLLVTAEPGDLDSTRIHETIGLGPIPRGPGWLFTDSCWVELDEVQRLLDDALPFAVGRVFAAVEGHDLVAYVAADDPAVTPAWVHARCMATLPGRAAAMAPGHYVICEGAPDDLSNISGWQRQRIVSAGSGRV